MFQRGNCIASNINSFLRVLAIWIYSQGSSNLYRTLIFFFLERVINFFQNFRVLDRHRISYFTQPQTFRIMLYLAKYSLIQHFHKLYCFHMCLQFNCFTQTACVKKLIQNFHERVWKTKQHEITLRQHYTLFPSYTFFNVFGGYKKCRKYR